MSTAPYDDRFAGTARSSGGKKRKAARGRHYPWLFVLFFVVIFAVNGVMVYVGATSYNGLDTDNAYEKGINYNDTLEALRAQERLGWGHEADVAGSADSRRMTLKLTGPDGRALEGADVRAMLVRPAARDFDREVSLREVAPGLHVADLGRLPADGLWEVRARVVKGEDSYSLTERFVLR